MQDGGGEVRSRGELARHPLQQQAGCRGRQYSRSVYFQSEVLYPLYCKSLAVLPSHPSAVIVYCKSLLRP